MNKHLPFVSNFAIHNYMKAEEGIIHASKSNFQVWYIDLGILGDGVNNWGDCRINNLRNLISHYQVNPIMHSDFMHPLSSEVAEVRNVGVRCVMKEIDLAYQINAPLIIHGGVISGINITSNIKYKAIENYLRSLIILEEYARKLNVNLYLENLCNSIHDKTMHNVFSEQYEFKYILGNIDLPLYLDIGHANLCGGNPISLFEEFSNRIIGMCFSNNDGIKDLHMDIDDGSIDYLLLIRSIIKKEWKGLIAFETRNKVAYQNIKSLVKIYEHQDNVIYNI